MALYKLKVGKHVQADPDAPTPKPDPVTGVTPKRPSRQYKPGDYVESDVDLVALLGGEKFELVKGKPKEEAPPAEGYSFPGGQVVEGRQVTAGLASGGTATGTEGQVAAQQAHAAQNAAKAPAKAKAAPTQQELEGKTVEELRAYAAEEEVNLHGAHNKNDIIKAIRGR